MAITKSVSFSLGMDPRSFYFKKLVPVLQRISATIPDDDVLNVLCRHDVSYLIQFGKAKNELKDKQIWNNNIVSFIF